MAQLAIKGHATRGSEVIALLEMMGGDNANNCYGKYYSRAYYINENGYIDQDFIPHIEQNTKFIIYTLEEFEGKFPYKVGDKVKNARINDFIGRITNARWDCNEEQIIYVVEWDDVSKSTLTYFARGLQPYKEETMKDKINIAELLKDCPTGMELDCTSYDNVSFDKISEDKKANYPIFCYITDEKGNRNSISFTEYGCESKRYGAKCVIFPKGKTTWEGFQRPFKDGDILATNDGKFIAIIKKNGSKYYCCCHTNGTYFVTDCSGWFDRLATEEEKQKLFDIIKDNGYKWNAETKTLEKLPKFKVGDKVKHISAYASGIVVKITDKGYYIDYPKGEGVCYIGFTLEKDYELAPDKFDITTLKPFESKVLVRDSEDLAWRPAIFGLYKPQIYEDFPFIVVGGVSYSYCIPYEGNEHLLGTTNDCDDFYKTWEK